MKTYKGFDENLQCRGFQYKVGKTYIEEGNIEVCHNGFHAIGEDNSPLRVFDYYPPANNGKPSRYCEVEADGEVLKRDEKVCCSKLTVGAEIGIPGLVKAHVKWVKKHITNENNTEPGKHAKAGDSGAAKAGDSGAATAGDSGAATAGDSGAATAGYSGAATAGEYGAATAVARHPSARTALPLQEVKMPRCAVASEPCLWWLWKTVTITISKIGKLSWWTARTSRPTHGIPSTMVNWSR